MGDVPGQKAVELCRELSRGSCWLPKFNYALHAEVLAEMDCQWKILTKKTTELAGKHSEGAMSQIYVTLQSFERNKRCLMAYHQHRLQKVQGLRWSIGSNLPAEFQEKLSDRVGRRRFHTDDDAPSIRLRYCPLCQ
eukprot:GHVL01041019.1.p1 GENE.GHVL01041019.1~~GHVL01041019.1.p1  ORF type:complete len:136 (-),score=13.48 GHVL01041019.1:207-614(-)